jgi:tetratricopeptide (TPR) repeat protein
VLTIHVLARDNSETISDCLSSLSVLGGRVVVGDRGSRDHTAEMARDLGAEVVRIDPTDELAAARNSLCGEDWNMYIEPWERLVSGADSILSADGNRSFYVLDGGVVSKQIRLWQGGRFENPVFETLSGVVSVVDPSIVVAAGNRPDTRAESTEACRRWVSRKPTSAEPYYYLACCLLAEGRGAEFMAAAKNYLSMPGAGGDSVVLLNYYLARQEFAAGRVEEAFRRAVGCVFSEPSFAEFWCLVGDMLSSVGDYRKAIHMYENARVCGARRRSDDSFPIEISKYESYPKIMEEKCRGAVSKELIVSVKRT